MSNVKEVESQPVHVAALKQLNEARGSILEDDNLPAPVAFQAGVQATFNVIQDHFFLVPKLTLDDTTGEQVERTAPEAYLDVNLLELWNDISS